LKAYKANITEGQTAEETPAEETEEETTAAAAVNEAEAESPPAAGTGQELEEAAEDITETSQKSQAKRKETKGTMEARLESLAKMYESKKAQRTKKPEADSTDD
jgi:hypothetical protein